MKHTILTAAILLLFCTVSNAEDRDLPNITVHGTATTMVTPDTMSWELTVRNIGKELPAVASNHAEIVQNVLKLLKKLKVPDDEIQTARMEFGENWIFRNNSRVKDGYFASTDVVFKVKDLKKYETLWIELSNIDAVSIKRIYYDHSKRIDYQNATRRKALLAGKEKAKTLAETLGSQIGEPLLIEEDAPQQGLREPLRSNAIINTQESTDNGEILAPGKIPIQMRVKVSFRLITPE